MTALPSGWCNACFQDVANIQLGKMLDKAKNQGVPTPYLRNVNVRWGRVDTSDVLTMSMSDEERTKFAIEDGDVLVCEGGEPGRAAVWRSGATDLKFQKALLRLRPNSATCSDWLATYLRFAAQNGILGASFSGTTIKHLPREALQTVALPLPPLTEQRRIVAKIDSLSAKSERARVHLDYVPRLIQKYKQAVLDASVAGLDARAPLFDFVEEDRGIPYGIIQTGTALSKGVPTVRCGDIKDYEVNSAALKRVDPSIESAYSRTRLRGGEVLIAIRGSIGNTCVVPSDLAGCNISREVAMIPIKGENIPHFFSYYLTSSEARYFISGNTRGVAQQGINLADLRSVPVPVLRPAEQRQVVGQIHSAFKWIDRLATEATGARKLIEHLDQAILSKAFRGELVPQDPDDEPASVMLERIKAERAESSPTRRGRGRPRLATTT